ncbi:MAG: hypothetical protein QOD72_861, partial [Acidimicrobiaceae bacterium]|nr:hypothetical protein [Acidimicrobiaceae bacterium]
MKSESRGAKLHPAKTGETAATHPTTRARSGLAEAAIERCLAVGRPFDGGTITAFPDSHLDLLDSPGVASLCTLGADEHPQVTAIWFVRDGDRIVASLTTNRQKFMNAARRPHVTLFLIDPQNPYRT